MRIGIVCPYDWSVPGGVQAHIYDIALEFQQRGHEVDVLAPVSDESALPAWVTSGGEPVAVNYNGSVARLSFGLRATRRVRKWIRSGDFDVVHVHEPLSPSLSALTCWAATGPIVATFHSSMERSRILSAGYSLAQTVLEKVRARIAVSELARQTVVNHVGGDAVLIPNGIHVSNFADVPPLDGQRRPQRVAFLGRFDEPRKGFDLLLAAFAEIVADFSDAELVVAGPGDAAAVLDARPELRDRVRFLGRVSDEEKAAMLRSAAVYVAPNTGGESFGIVLIEALACRTPVIASDLPAFVRVLDGGAAGRIFANGSVPELTAQLREVLSSPDSAQAVAERAFDYVQRFDWSRVATSVLDVYATVTAGGVKVTEDLRGLLGGRLLGD